MIIIHYKELLRTWQQISLLTGSAATMARLPPPPSPELPARRLVRIPRYHLAHRVGAYVA